MSIYSVSAKPKIAEEDIKVYKVVKVIDGQYITPFQDKPLMEIPEETQVDIDSTIIHMVPSYSCEEEYIPIMPVIVYKISSGTIHAYTTKRSAIANAKDPYARLGTKTTIPYKVIDGIIPKGTEYWTSYNKPEICSRFIKFNLDSDND